MEEIKNTLLIDDVEYEIPKMVINSIGQECFDKLSNAETSLEMRYLVLKKLELFSSNCLALLVYQDTLKERELELIDIADYVKKADFFAGVNKLEEANELLLKSIKAHLDIYNEAKGIHINK